MNRIISMLIVVLMVVSVLFAVPFTAYAKEVEITQTSFDEYDMRNTVFVDVSAIATEDESFWAFVWYGESFEGWVPMQISEPGMWVVKMREGECAVFARMKSGEQPDWFLVNLQTEDLQYTGLYNCAVLSYADTSGRMSVEWTVTEVADKSVLREAMLKAEKYMYEEHNKYTYESMFELRLAYSDAEQCYKRQTPQAGIDASTKRLNDAMRGLVTKEEAGIVDKDRLWQAISTATSHYMSLDKFTDSSWNRMIRKLDVANAVCYDENATQAEVDFAAQELFDAIDGLERVKELIGDVDGDGKVSVMDATFIQRHLAQLATIYLDKLECSDTDKDGRISIVDATMIQRFIAQLIPSL